jgi:hypothetical protein
VLAAAAVRVIGLQVDTAPLTDLGAGHTTGVRAELVALAPLPTDPAVIDVIDDPGFAACFLVAVCELRLTDAVAVDTQFIVATCLATFTAMPHVAVQIDTLAVTVHQ